MALPNYIVNLEEFVQAVVGGFIGDGRLPQGKQESKGFILHAPTQGVFSEEWLPNKKIEITGLKFAQDDVRNLGYDDYFNLYINNEKIISQVFFKEMAEHKKFREFFKVDKEDVIRIEYFNESGIGKYIKFDIDYIEELESLFKEIDIVCKDRHTLEVIKKKTLFYDYPRQVTINPPNISYYKKDSEPFILSINKGTASPFRIIFYYVRSS